MSVFFSSRKTVFKSLLDTSSTPGYLSSFQAFFSYCNLDTSLTLGGSIEKVPIPTIASRHLVDWSSLISCVWCFCTSKLSQHLYLSIAKSLTPGSTPLDTFICWDLLRFYIFSSCDLSLISLNLSLDSFLYSSPKHSHLTPNLLLKVSSSFFKIFVTWKASNLSFFMHFMFWNLSFGDFEKFWGFSKLMSVCWNFRMGFV